MAGFGGKAVEPLTNVLHMLLTSFYGKVPGANEGVEFSGIAPLCGYAYLDEKEKTPVALADATFVTFALFRLLLLANLFLFLLTLFQMSFT